MLQAAARIADGQVPYRDFWWFYPPGQPYLLGGLRELVRPVAAAWRIVRVLARRGGGRARLRARARAAARAAARARRLARRDRSRWRTRAARTRSRSRSRSRSARCCASSGARRSPACWRRGAAWRIEFAAYPALAILLACAAPTGWPRAPRARRPRRRPPPSLYLPVVVAAGLGPSLGPARRLPADRLPRLPVAAVPARLRRPAQHRLARRLPLGLAPSRCCSSTCRSRSCSGLAGALVGAGAGARARRWRQSRPRVFALGMLALPARRAPTSSTRRRWR